MAPQQKRDALLERALHQLKKSKSLIDPHILQKIRQFIGKNPKLMKSLGVKPHDIPDHKKDVEVIDQAKTMEIMAKLMELKPEGREQIKAEIKKARD